jgi:hypothetical protein
MDSNVSIHVSLRGNNMVAYWTQLSAGTKNSVLTVKNYIQQYALVEQNKHVILHQRNKHSYGDPRDMSRKRPFYVSFF